MAGRFCVQDTNQLVGVCSNRFCDDTYCIAHIEYSNDPVSDGEPGEEFENGINSPLNPPKGSFGGLKYN